MAKATPVTGADKAPQEPAKATELFPEPAAPLAVKKTDRLAEGPKADPADLDAMVEAARKDGKAAQIVGNAVRIDN